MNFEGVYTALITPFHQDQSVDYPAFEKLIEHQISEGINGLVILGTTGESPTVNPDETKTLFQRAVSVTAGRVPVIAGTGSNATKKAIELSELAKSCGCDALLQVNPYYNKPTQEGLYLHFRAVAQAVNLPVILYNIKGRSAVNLETKTLLRLANIDNIVAVKEASGDVNQIKEVIENVPTDFHVLSGDDNLTLEMLKMGGKGVVSVLSNLLPGKMRGLVDAGLRKDWVTADQINQELTELFDLCFIETNPQPIKTWMAHLGFCEEVFRLPITHMSSDNKATILAALDRYRTVKQD